MLRAVLLVMGGTLASRVLGLVRQAVFNALYPDALKDAFNVAYRVPNLLRELLAEGAVQNALIPLLKSLPPEEAQAFARRFAAFLFGVNLLVLGLGYLLAPWVAGLLVAEESHLRAPEAFQEVVYLTRLLLPFLLAVAFPLYALLHLARRFPASATSGLAEALGHALLVALPVAFLSVGMALPIAYLASRYPSAASRTLERLAYLAYAIPPLAYALAWIFFSLRTLPFLYGTLALLVLALALHFLTESLGPVRSALAQVPPRLEEAARTLGDTPTRAFFRVTFPLLWRGAAAGGSLAFIGAMKELPITLLLAPTGFSTLATRVFGYTQEAMFAEAAPFALLIVGLSAAFVGVLLWNERRF